MGASGAPIPASAPTGARVSGGWPRWCRRRRHVSRMCATKTYRSVDGTMRNTFHGCPYEYSESMLWSVRRVCTLMRHMRQPVLLVRHRFRARGSVCVLCASPDLQNGAAWAGQRRRPETGGRARSGRLFVLNVRCALSPAPSAPWSWPWSGPERAFFEIGWRHQGASQSHLKRTPEAASKWTTSTGLVEPDRGTPAPLGPVGAPKKSTCGNPTRGHEHEPPEDSGRGCRAERVFYRTLPAMSHRDTLRTLRCARLLESDVFHTAERAENPKAHPITAEPNRANTSHTTRHNTHGGEWSTRDRVRES